MRGPPPPPRTGRALGTALRAHTFVDGSLRTSPSRVRPVTCDGGSPGGGSSVSEVRIPSLKPFTAPPKSWPMLRSFFVPKISTTTNSTISQCQMLRPPIIPSLSSSPPEHRPERLRPAEDVHVDVPHVLPSHAARVDDRAKTVACALLARKAAGERQDLAERRPVLVGHVVQRGDVAL